MTLVAKSKNKQNQAPIKSQYTSKLPKFSEIVALQSKARNSLFEMSDNICDDQQLSLLIQQQNNLGYSNEIKDKNIRNHFDIGFSPWNRKNKENVRERINQNIKRRHKKPKQGEQAEYKSMCCTQQLDEYVKKSRIPNISKSIQKQEMGQIFQKKNMPRYSSHYAQKVHIQNKKGQTLLSSNKLGFVNSCQIYYNRPKMHREKHLMKDDINITQIVTIMKKKRSLPIQQSQDDILKVLSNKQILLPKYMKHNSKIYDVDGENITNCNQANENENIKSCFYDQEVYVYHGQLRLPNEYWRNKTKNTKLKRLAKKKGRSTQIVTIGTCNSALQLKSKSSSIPLGNLSNPKQLLKVDKKINNSSKKDKKSINFNEYHSNNPLTRLLYQKYLHTINVGSYSRDNINANAQRRINFI